MRDLLRGRHRDSWKVALASGIACLCLLGFFCSWWQDGQRQALHSGPLDRSDCHVYCRSLYIEPRDMRLTNPHMGDVYLLCGLHLQYFVGSECGSHVRCLHDCPEDWGRRAFLQGERLYGARFRPVYRINCKFPAVRCIC